MALALFIVITFPHNIKYLFIATNALGKPKNFKEFV